MIYSIYGNCQTATIAHYLNAHTNFSKQFSFEKLMPVHLMSTSDISEVKNIFTNSDLLIHQVIKDNYKTPELSTSQLMKFRKEQSLSITFPSLFFSAYAPHCAPFKGVKSILNLLHDYIILYCYANNMTEQETLDLIGDKELYPKSTSLDLLDNSFKTLEERETLLDIKISAFVKEHYKSAYLFPHFQHPIDIVSVYIVNKILKSLSLIPIQEDNFEKIFSSNVSTPIYKSTYQNLECTFKVNFTKYQTINGYREQDEVVRELFKTYDMLDKKDIITTIQRNKPFIIKMFKELNI